jgi:hypothetical protein
MIYGYYSVFRHFQNLKKESSLLISLLIPKNRENPPSTNELLSKGRRSAYISASHKASRKVRAFRSLKQRKKSGHFGELCQLQKQVAVLSDE